jgi:secreted trypsin-like serine protease
MDTMSRGFVSLACLVAALSIPPRATFRISVHGGIVIPAGTAKYNYIVQLKNGSDTVCGGIAVGSQWVLTAAHCALEASRAVSFGASAESFIQNQFCHPGCVSSSSPPSLRNVANDLALLRTEPLAGEWLRANVAAPNRSNLVVFGWGKESLLGLFNFGTELRKSKPMQLQDARDAQGVLECDKFWKTERQVVDTNELCAGDASSSACPGDSGGPIFNTVAIASELEPRTLVGILSQADDACNDAGVFDIYTAIDSGWMEDVIQDRNNVRSHSPCPCP